MRLADRMYRLGTESAFEMLARARALEATGRKVIHLELGEPDFDTPQHIRDAAAAALDAGQTHYVPAPGIPPLREAVAKFLGDRGRLDCTPDQVIVMPGAKPVMFYTIMVLCQEGDEVLYPDPGFPMYESITAFAGATPVPIPLREENEFRIDPDELESLVTERSKLLIINTPHNPCGSALTQAEIERIAEIAMRHDLIVLSDEVYWAMPYEDVHRSVLQVDGMKDRTILLDGWSKTFAMTGWRLGFGVFPSELVEPITRMVINSVSCTSAFSQVAAKAALEGPWEPVEQMVAEFRTRREVVVSGLNAIDGVSCVTPGGAFYAFPSIKELGVTSKEVEGHLLDDAGVACLSGTAFGQHGEGYLRLSYANSIDNLQAALDAMKASLPNVRATAPAS
jgi:aspartate/methionine/tyrosine aminotransferase